MWTWREHCRIPVSTPDICWTYRGHSELGFKVSRLDYNVTCSVLVFFLTNFLPIWHCRFLPTSSHHIPKDVCSFSLQSIVYAVSWGTNRKVLTAQLHGLTESHDLLVSFWSKAEKIIPSFPPREHSQLRMSMASSGFELAISQRWWMLFRCSTKQYPEQTPVFSMTWK